MTEWGKRWPWRGRHGNVAQGRNGGCPLCHGDNTSRCGRHRAHSLQAVCTHRSCSQGTTVTPKGGKSEAAGMGERWGQGWGWRHSAAGPHTASWRGCRPIAGARFPHARYMLGVFRAGCVDTAPRPCSSALAQLHAWPWPLLTIKAELKALAKPGTALAGCPSWWLPNHLSLLHVRGQAGDTPCSGWGPFAVPSPCRPCPMR